MSEAKYYSKRFNWRCRDVGSVTYVSFEGELDLHAVRLASGSIRMALAGPAKMVVVDMSALSFLDSSGLGFLIRTKKEVEESDGKLLVSRLSPEARRIIDLGQLNAWFDPVEEYPSKLVPCPVCGDPLPQHSRRCNRCGSAL